MPTTPTTPANAPSSAQVTTFRRLKRPNDRIVHLVHDALDLKELLDQIKVSSPSGSEILAARAKGEEAHREAKHMCAAFSTYTAPERSAWKDNQSTAGLIVAYDLESPEDAPGSYGPKQQSEVFGGLFRAGVQFLHYPSPSSTDADPRDRFVVWPARPVVSEADYLALGRSLFGDAFDESGKSRGRGMYITSDAEVLAEPGSLVEVPQVEPEPTSGVFEVPSLDDPVALLWRPQRCPAGVEPADHFVQICRRAPPAVEGRNGHSTLMRLANWGVVGLELDPEVAAEIAWQHYNPRCSPPWRDEQRADFDRKFTQANQGEPGYLLPRGEVRWTDAGVAEALAADHASDLQWCEERRSWLRWNGCQWSLLDGEAAVSQAVIEIAKDGQQSALAIDDHDRRKRVLTSAMAYEQSAKIAGARSVLATMPSMRVHASQLDSDAHLLNCANGVLDLRSGQLSPHDPSLLMTKCTGVDYVPGARSELWDRYLDDLTGGDDELRAYLQRAAGLSLWGYPREKAFFFVYGVPDSGKSKLLDALRAALGDYAQVAAFDTWLQRQQAGGNRGDLVELLGARLVVSSEVRPNAKLDSELVKAVTGGDTLKHAAKYERDVEIRPTFTLWWAANDRPRVRADDSGFWSRARVIGCKQAVPKERQIANLAEQWAQPEHARAILVWLVEGCLVWQRDGLGSCAVVDTEISAYRESQDPTAEFWRECVTASEDGFVSRAALRSGWEDWADANGVKASWVKPAELYQKLAERFDVKACVRRGTRGVLGIRLNAS